MAVNRTLIRTVIIEDEKPAARKLERLLSEFSELEIVAVLHSVEEGKSFFSSQEHPDLIFSDIVLGDGVSFDIFDQIPTESFVIYTTAFDNYTLRAFKLNSIDYLLKPIGKSELEQALDKFRRYMPRDQHYQELNFKDLITEPKSHLSRILVKLGYHLKVVRVEEVSYFYSENKIVYLKTNDRPYPTDLTLEELQESLDPKEFFRVNRQVIIRLSAIESIHTSPYYKLTMQYQNLEEITVSRERIKEFKMWLES